MTSGSTCDEDLLRRLPLPLAQLYRRAHNAKTPLDRHLTAYYLWEAWLKLFATVLVVEYADRPDHDPEMIERLKNLARPSTGHWWEIVRRLLPILAEGGRLPFAPLHDKVLGKTRDDLPRAAGLDAVLSEALDGRGGARATVRLSELFDRMVRYRNRELGHGAAGQKPGEWYERMGRAILAGATELFARVDVLDQRRLLFVGDVRRRSSGGWQVERFDLTGEGARRLETLELPDAGTTTLPRPEQVYIEAAGGLAGLRLAQPLLAYDPNTEELLFLNSRRGRKRTEYLCYNTGRLIELEDSGGESRPLIARIFGILPESTELGGGSTHDGPESPAAIDETSSVTSPVRRMGEFEILGELGRGGMGVVYRAYQPSLGRQVALKSLLRAGDAKAEARFAREIRALGRVEHPNLVKVFTSGAEGDQWFYAMELLAGRTLADEETQPGPPSRDAVRRSVDLIQQVADATHALHEASVIHRDIKPGNIMLVAATGSSADGVKAAHGQRAVLMDLGLAQVMDEGAGRLTKTRQFVGTLRYASPEQVLGTAALDRGTDIYSLGATLWELLAGRPIHEATELTPNFEIEKRIMFGEPGSVRRYNPVVPVDLDAIVQKCLEKEPKRRYLTARELADDLGRYLSGQPVTARPAGLARRVTRAVRRRPLVALGTVALIGAMVLGVVGFQFWDARYRVKTDFFADFCMRHGAPVGIHRVSEAAARRRSVTWRFVSRWDPLESTCRHASLSIL